MVRENRPRGLTWGHLSVVLVINSLVWTCMSQLPPSSPIRIDCGNIEDTKFEDEQGLQWYGDMGYQNGTAVTLTVEGLNKVDSTYRKFPRGDPCYRVVVPNGRYLVRASFAYFPDDPDSEDSPLMGLSLNGVSVEVIQINSQDAFYTSFSLDVKDSLLEMCLRQLNMVPFINSIEILPQDSRSYLLNDVVQDAILSMHVRMNVGGPQINEPDDPGFRLWNSDDGVWTGLKTSPIPTDNVITIDAPFNTYNLPRKLFQTARVGEDGVLNFTHGNLMQEDGRNQFMVVLYFAELDQNVKVGGRVFDIIVNGRVVRKDFDILEVTTGVYFSAYLVQAATMLLPGGVVDVRLQSNRAGSYPILSGLELFEIIIARPDPVLTPDSPVRIDCGGPVSFENDYGVFWRADTGYSSGYVSTVPLKDDIPKNYMNGTLRYFPEGYKNCYVVPLPSMGRYIVRLSMLYNNYDEYSTPPTFQVSVQREFVYNITVPVDGPVPRGALDILAYVPAGVGEVCFYPDDIPERDETDPFINGLEFLPIDTRSYTDLADFNNTNTLLVNLARINCGGPAFGDGLDNLQSPSGATDKAFRAWLDGSNHLVATGGQSVVRVDPATIAASSSVAPNYFPQTMYASMQTTALAGLEYTIRISDWLDADVYLVYVHFAELNSTVVANQRLFDIFFDNQIVATKVDVVTMANGTMKGIYIAQQIRPAGPDFSIALRPSTGSILKPIINGLEIFRVETAKKASDQKDVAALAQLKMALKVLEASGWQGDPCAPVEWDGLNCSPDDETPWKITDLELGEFRLNGTIPPSIGQLDRLETLNLSSNHLTGSIPPELGNLPLLNYLDLSNNKLSGPIPATVLALTNRTDFKLLLGGNSGLCGGGGYGKCGKKSAGTLVVAVIAVVIGSVLLVGLLAALCVYMRRRRAFAFHRMADSALYDSDILKGPETEGAGTDLMREERKMKLPPKLPPRSSNLSMRTDSPRGSSDRASPPAYESRIGSRGRDSHILGMDVELGDNNTRRSKRDRPQKRSVDDVVFVGFEGK